MLIKSFVLDGSGHSGQDVASWTRDWEAVDNIAQAAKGADKSYLSSYFKKYFPKPPGKVLEGGCGIGKYVIAYRRLGYDITGVDFSSETVKRLKASDKDLPVYLADIAALPFRDSSFDCYFSGGVIEHFEEGPGLPLSEARRVIKDKGILLATVPYVNLLRRCYFSLMPENIENTFVKKRRDACRKEEEGISGYRFCQYFFDKSSIEPYFKESGFSIEKIFPVDFIWGEIGMFMHKYIRPSGRHSPGSENVRSGKNTVPAKGASEAGLFKKLAYDFFIRENRDNIFFRIPIDILNHLAGHMVLIVARATL